VPSTTGRWWLPRGRVEWLALCAGIMLAFPAIAVIAPLPSLESRLAIPGNVVLAADGGVIERDVADGVRIPVTLDRISPAMLQATVAAEDQRFWSHPGIDPLAMARAAVNLGRSRSGASTLTQQLVRSAYLDAGQTLLLRKPREMLYAIALEARTSKDDVLQAYLNHVYYGRGAYGVEAAARTYFGVSASQVDLAQAAFLAGLPRSPVEYDAATGAPAARDRQRYVLDRMVATGEIDAGEAAEAHAVSLGVVPAAPPSARHISAMVYEELRRVLPSHADASGLVIHTTLDPPLQHEAERSVRTRLGALNALGDHHATSAAVVVLDPRDGRLLAVVGSAHFEADAGQINMALQPRQPGSALKPLIYALALERGFTAASMLLDIPSTFEAAGGPYRPVNYDLRFRGPVTMRTALGSSLNVPAVRMTDALGVDAVLEFAHQAGLESLEATEVYGLSLALGGGGVRLIDLTAAFGAFAVDGVRYEPWLIARVTDQAGRTLYQRGAAPPRRVTTPQVAYLVADMLADPTARIAGFGSSSVLNTAYRAAVKTGTSSEFRDNWTVGFTPERVVGVWVGNADYSPMVNVSGVAGAAPIWRDVMTTSVRGLPRTGFTRPDGLLRVEVCAPTGQLPGPACASPVSEWFIAGTEPTAVETYYHSTPDGALAIDPPAEARAWAADAGWRLHSAARGEPVVALVQPSPGAVLVPAPELGRSAVILRASVPPTAEAVDFFVGGVHAGRATSASPQIEWPLVAGVHDVVVVARLETGERVEAHSTYEVRPR
jgi:penicillin-binding protein 1C